LNVSISIQAIFYNSCSCKGSKAAKKIHCTVQAIDFCWFSGLIIIKEKRNKELSISNLIIMSLTMDN